MNIYCDESGGSNENEKLFVVSSVLISDISAGRHIRKFRNKTGITGEIKGKSLSDNNRRLFFEMLAKSTDALAVAISCSRSTSIGGWAMNSYEESEIYEQMLIEACSQMAVDPSRPIAIYPDQGRYKASKHSRIAPSLDAALEACLGTPVTVDFRDSSLPGIQIADVVSNTVYRHILDGIDDVNLMPCISALTVSQRLRLSRISLTREKPLWLENTA